MAPVPTTQAENTLRKYALNAAVKLATIGDWHTFVLSERGRPDIAAAVADLPHKAARLLDHLRRRGASVSVHTEPWTVERLQQAAMRGSHQSAKEEVAFVCAEMLEFCSQGFWTVLPLSVALLLPNLRLSPLGMVPQRNRRSRLIVDYSFSGVNDETVKLAPPEATQFGRALHRLMQRIVHAEPAYGPVYLGKIDIADGFYRIGLQPHDIPRLGAILPTTTGERLVDLPLALPMGWVDSPPYFTAVTETACDLTNDTLRRRTTALPRHPLESLALTPPPNSTSQADWTPRLASPGSATPRPPPLAYADVYVDDFVLAAQTKRHRQRVLRAALHSIDSVLRPLAPDDRASRKEPISVKKLRHGDACWATSKTILGWDVDTAAGTLSLPPHRLARLYDLLDALPATRKRVPVREWHQLLGELRSMAPALPGARGLFSALQDALTRRNRTHVRITRRVHDGLADFRAIADSLRERPTRLRELVPVGPPAAHGACDASQRGMGGVWFVPGMPPVLWRTAFPSFIQRELVTSNNRTGTLSISDLELAGTIAQKQILVQLMPVAERPIWLAGDNKASLAWATKGSSTSVSARAYLLRLNALHQRQHRYVPLHDYIAGTANAMADDASRRWDLSDTALLTHFNAVYPQASSWRLLTLTPGMHSAVIGALSRKRSTRISLRTGIPPPPAPGPSGNGSVFPSESGPTSSMCPVTPSPCSCCSPSGIAPVPSLPATSPSALARWKTPSAMWRRRSPGWGPRTLA